ncbi:MAG: sigma-54 dependent transcriptional regulator [Bacillota bacterium]
MVAQILVIDDEEEMRWALTKALAQEGYGVVGAGTARQGLEILRTKAPALVLLDLKLPDMDGLDVLRLVKESYPGLPVIMITGYGTIETAVQALKRGAAGYITKPFDLHELKLVVRRVLEINQLHSELDFLRSELTRNYQDLVGCSRAVLELRELIRRVAPTDATVLITGESGTGKEVVAVAIHRLSPRGQGPFVPVNCAAVPEHLLESELFGHEKGAFTGAIKRHIGRFELAHRGTIFLDEVTEMSPVMQAKLLRVLQDKTFTRVGGTQTLHVDMRVIAATNRPVEDAVAEGHFREDLYYRLNVVRIHIPPLRERREDVPLLVRHFLQRFRPCYQSAGISPEALELLCRYRWPGNVRELQNVIERALILCQGEEIRPHHLPRELQEGLPAAQSLPVPGEDLSLEQVEKLLIQRALVKTGGNRSRAARLLGISRSALLYRMQKYGLQ